MIVVVSDNGASGEGGPNGSVNEMKFANGVARRPRRRTWRMIDELGGTKTYNHYPNGWAMAFNTPFKMWKRYEFNGGTCDPCIISWPAGIEGARRGPRRSTTTRSTSCRRSSTCSASSRRRRSRGTRSRRSTASACATASTTPSAESNAQDAVLRDARLPLDLARGLEGRHDPSRASPAGATSTTTSGSSTTSTSTAPSCNNLAAEQPDKLRELVNIWFSEAGANGAFPLDDRTPVEILTTPRPQLTAPRNRYVYFPDTAPVAEWQAVNTQEPLVRDRRARRHPRSRAPRACSSRIGSRFGGHALYVKDNRLHYVNNFVGAEEQMIVGTEDVPTGENLILSASFEKEGMEPTLRDRHAVALPRRHEGRRGQDQDAARRLRDRRLGAVRRPAQRRAGDRRLPGRASVRVHRRHDQPGRGRRQRRARTSTSSARPRC